MPEQSSPEITALPPERTKEEVVALKKWHGEIDRLVDVDFKAANHQPEYEDDIELKRKQRKILKNLPENFAEELAAHLKATYTEQAKYGHTQLNDVSLLKGEIFERLLESENEIYHLDPDWEKRPQTEEQKDIADRLLVLMATPERFGFEGAIKNPDMVSIIFENGVFTIGASLEAKTHLDERSLRQLKTFRFNLKLIVEKINRMADASEHGLIGLGQNGHQLAVSEQYTQMLAVPRNSKLDDQNKQTSFIDWNMDSKKRQELIGLINDPNQVTTVFSSFNRAEINALTRHFMKQVQEKLDQETE